jgi:hypothetical protein
MWATMLHLFLGNAVIGLVEGILLERLFNCGVRRSILILIAANYVSAWVGCGLVSGGLGMLPEITIETVRFWSWVFFVIAFVLTLLIELPFVRWVMPPQGKTFGQVLKAAVTVNAISYGLLFGWYWMASGTSMMTPLQVVPASSLVQGDEYELFFILKTEMAEGESAAVIGPTRLPASRVASPCRCNRCEPESLVEPSTTPSSSLSIPVSRIMLWRRRMLSGRCGMPRRSRETWWSSNWAKARFALCILKAGESRCWRGARGRSSRSEGLRTEGRGARVDGAF